MFSFFRVSLPRFTHLSSPLLSSGLVEARPTMSTKKALSDAPGAEVGEFDVRFGEGELGLRLEERGSFEASSVVVRITEDGE